MLYPVTATGTEEVDLQSCSMDCGKLQVTQMYVYSLRQGFIRWKFVQGICQSNVDNLGFIFYLRFYFDFFLFNLFNHFVLRFATCKRPMLILKRTMEEPNRYEKL